MLRLRLRLCGALRLVAGRGLNVAFQVLGAALAQPLDAAAKGLCGYDAAVAAGAAGGTPEAAAAVPLAGAGLLAAAARIISCSCFVIFFWLDIRICSRFTFLKKPIVL
jgi:hypothetical protein